MKKRNLEINEYKGEIMAAGIPYGTRRRLLPLLPPGPDGVCSPPLRRIQLPNIAKLKKPAKLVHNPYKYTIMAEREGFEPSVHLLGIHTISSRAPSASSDISPIIKNAAFSSLIFFRPLT